MKPQLGLLTIFAALLCFSCGATERTEQLAGGKCQATIVRDNEGKVIDVKPVSPCVGGRPTQELFVIDHEDIREPLKENTGSITFGEGTTTCYGPPNPTPAMCICTARPCP